MATHAVFTIVADVKAGAERQLEKDLQAFDVAEKFKGVPSLHFASFVVFDPDCLHLPLSKLVLECAIDGPIAPFLRDLVQRCDLSPAFTHCEGYDQATDALAFLQSHVRKPQLYHVGTPYQSAASILSDIKERDELNHRLRKAGVLSLDGLLDSAPAGMREFWRLEILQPWLALPTAVAGLWLAWLIWRNTNWHGWQSVPSFLDTLVAVAVAFVALRSAFVMWQSALPDLRRRVVSWLKWFAKGVVLGALTLVAVRVWPRHAVPIVSWVSTLFGAATLYRIYTDVSSQRDARLSETRGNTSIDAAWRALKNTPFDTSEPRAYRSWTWRGVLDVLTAAALFVLIWFAVYYAQSNGISTAIVVAWATGIMVLRAAWLTVRGFRANGLWLEARHGIAAFLGFAAFVGIVVGFTLTRTPAFVGAAIGLVFVFALGPLWNWRWWIAGYPLAYLSLSAAIESGHTVEVHLAVTTLFFLKAWWLTVLIGWPGEKPAPLWTAKVKWFIALATLGGFILIDVLIRICPWPSLTAVLIPAALFGLWLIEVLPPEVPGARPSRARLNDLRSQEDHDVQNHMAALVPVRQAWFRPPVLRSFLWLLNSLFFQAWVLRDWYKGKLFGLPTVHFAQWVLLDDRNYVFLSNYDLSWTTYLDDFGTTIAPGIQKIWGQGERNPGTTHLGAFKDYARSTMVKHSGWYRAYPGVTLRQIWNNEQIRQGVASATGEEAIVSVLRRFGAAPKTLPEFSNAGLR